LNNRELQSRLLRAIPGGAHTYSRGFDQYPQNAPAIMQSGAGGYSLGSDGHQYLDLVMALRSVNIGYAEPVICDAAEKYSRLGNNLSRPSYVELEAAERLIDTIDSVDMVKFAKNGSTAVTAAVKLARGYTGRENVAVCAQQPFFSYDDWFIGSTVISKGIPQSVQAQTFKFDYNDVDSITRLFTERGSELACLVMEAAALEHPAENLDGQAGNYLQLVQRLCNQYGVVFILDEMITGFRWDIKGAQHYYGITPDLCTFGKAMANGYSVAAVAGRREIMELGSIETADQERLFLLSSTHGAEMSSLGAFTATLDFMHDNPVVEHFWSTGSRIVKAFNRLSAKHGVGERFSAQGIDCSPYYTIVDERGNNDMAMRTLFLQEMVKQRVLMPCIALCYRHDEQALNHLEASLDSALEVCSLAANNDIEEYLQGPIVKPVFRKRN